MNKIFFLISAVIMVVFQLHAQTFTRITSGAIATDVGASRSVNWIDYDRDGYLDLFVSKGLEGGDFNLLHRNNRDGSFSKITADPIVSFRQPYDGASWADVDGDGDLDCFVVAWYDSNNTYFQNNGDGTFARTNIGLPVSDRGFSETCSWGDFDNDGKLDLYVTNSGSPSLGAKRNFLYRNTGAGFAKIDTGAIVTDTYYSRGASWVDYDNDGDQDMYVVNERNQVKNLYKNMLKETGAAWFTRITAGQFVSDVSSALSASWADYDNDGDLDVFVANGWPQGQNDFLYSNNSDGTFTKITSGDVVTDAAFSMSSGWGDFDNDGDLDLFVTTAYSGAATKNLLYKNLLSESGTPTLQKATSGSIANDVGYSYGAAWGDYDRDGDLDLFVAKTFNENESSAFYRNDNPNGNHWLSLNCVGTTSNRSGIGTKIRIKATVGGVARWQLRTVDGQSGYCAQNLQLHFGLGNATMIDSVKIEWPSGLIDVHTNVSVDRIANAVENGGLTSIGETTPLPPSQHRLFQNYPNPFNPTTTIRYSVKHVPFPIGKGEKGVRVSLKVHDLLGREVSTLVNELKTPGLHYVEFNAANLASGVYFYRLTAGSFSETKAMIISK
ncbi:MAG: VCBS repeat-containing protein [Ignavibacteriae bacterium]|nr:VCBS repeat-containing protein [Ignavibacteriota bacterium]